MKTKLLSIVALLSLGVPAFAHRLDEYLQAIVVSLEQDHIRASMRLIPGVAVATPVIAAVDSNADGVFSEAEQQTYARKVLHDVSLSVDGHMLKPQLRSVSFPAAADMKEGLGEIHIEFIADLPAGESHRTLVVENRHETRMSVYLMNCLVPQNRNIQVTAQTRNPNQSYYRVDYLQSGGQQDSLLSLWRSRLVTALAPFGGVPSMFRLGMRHIAEGTDHLLFLIALLLPAPLLAVGSRWTAFGGVHHSLIQIVRVVTAFTFGHSITLALGASGLVSLPGRPVEVLIAFSILVSAAHALCPLFPGREPMIAAGFGLIHGLAFATTLQKLGVGPWQRMASILGFNLGIETMQLIVVAAILPSLLILSRSPAYTILRFSGALFAGFASLGWIIERLLGVHTSVDLVVDFAAHRGAWIAISLGIISIASWLRHRIQGPKLVIEFSPQGMAGE
jgi:HupE / UreJ protein